MIIDQLTSHGDRVTYQPHHFEGRPFPSSVADAKTAAALLFGAPVEGLRENIAEGLYVWRAPGQTAPSIRLTRPSHVGQVEGSLHNVPAEESGLAAVIVMAGLESLARRAAAALMGQPLRVIHSDGIGWVWTANLDEL